MKLASAAVCLSVFLPLPSAANFATRQAATAVVIPWVPKSFSNKPVTHASASHPPRKSRGGSQLVPGLILWNHRLPLFGGSPAIEPTTVSCAWILERVKDHAFHFKQSSKQTTKKKTLLYQFSLARSPMRSTCTSCLPQRTRWSSQLGATQDGAALLRGRKSFRWRQRLCSLHLHGDLN